MKQKGRKKRGERSRQGEIARRHNGRRKKKDKMKNTKRGRRKCFVTDVFYSALPFLGEVRRMKGVSRRGIERRRKRRTDDLDAITMKRSDVIEKKSWIKLECSDGMEIEG